MCLVLIKNANLLNFTNLTLQTEHAQRLEAGELAL
jgi:hypothetical protein